MRCAVLGLAVAVAAPAALCAAADEIAVAHDNDNVVANRLPGKWEVDRGLSARLQKDDRGIEALEFVPDDRVAKLIPDDYRRLLQGKTTYLAGMMGLRGKRYPFILIELHGNPHLVWFQDRGGEWVKLFIAAAEDRNSDLLFIGGNFSDQPFCAFRRAGQKPVGAGAPGCSRSPAAPAAPPKNGAVSDLPVGPAVDPPGTREPNVPADPPAAWRLERASLQVIKGRYTQQVGNGQVTVAPALGKRLVLVRCRMTPLEADAQAVERLRRRRNLDAIVQIGGTTASGKYRLFDMARIHLLSPEGRRYPARWNVAPGAGMTVLTKSGQGIFGHDPLGWHGSYRNDEGLHVGLVDVGQTVAAGFIFEVSVIAEPDSLSIQLENSKPLPVKLTVD